MAGVKIVDLPSLGRDLASTDLLELSLAGGTGSRKITGQEIMNTSKLNIGTTAITSGVVGRVLFEGTGNVVQESANLFWNNTNGRLGIGTSTPTSALQIVGSTNVEGLLNITNNTTLNYANAVNILFPNMATNNQVAGFYIGKALSSKNGWGVNYIHSADGSNSNRGSIAFYGVDNILNWFASGNVGINTTTDAGFRLDVNGTARTGALSTGNVNLQGNLLYTNQSSAPNSYLYSASTITILNGLNIRLSGGPVCVNESGANATASSVLDVQSTTKGFLCPRMTTTQKNAIASPATGLQLFDSTTLAPSIYNGTNWQDVLVPNSAGNVGIGGTPARRLDVISDGTNWISGVFAGSGGTPKVVIGNLSGLATIGGHNATLTAWAALAINSGGGNVLIGTTTDAGFKLDVNGTLRVTGKTSLNGQLDTNQTGSGHAFIRVNDNGTLIRISNWGYGNPSGNTWVGGTEVASALFALNSTTSGFLPPRMTQVQRNAIASPAIGLEIYQTDAIEGKYIYKSSGWTYIG